jgi:hypothetical protein
MHSISDIRRWSPARKAQLMGAVVGLAVTVAALGLSNHTTYQDAFAYPIFVLNLVLCAPASLICLVLGIKVVLGAETSTIGLAAWYALVILSNMVLFALAGSAVGWLRGQCKTGSSHSHE